MKPATLRIALALSLLINGGVLGAVVYRHLGAPASTTVGSETLPRQLQLSPEQQQRWHAAEHGFLDQLQRNTHAIGEHRVRLVRAIFAEPVNAALIEAERSAIARLQDEQQKLVIRQLLLERDLLNPAQREQLARLLLAQPVGPTGVEQLHRD